ncbi:MAG: hypothetical protein M1457_06675 [bacterium]|nr:hypothetical protein [bacterium]
METIYKEEKTRLEAERRNELFWRGELDDYPLLWVLAPNGKTPPPVAAPASLDERWMNVDYVLDRAAAGCAATYYGGDALPVHFPNLGPDIFSAWLGAPLTFAPDTSWVHPIIEDWDEWSDPARFTIDTRGQWWKLYAELTRRSAEVGRGRWVTAYPDLHTGIDALSALRGPDRLNMDLLINPEPVKAAMRRMTELFKWVADEMDKLILPAGQGTSNWTLGWSAGRFIVVGQNDFTCMINPEMYREFCWDDDNETCNYFDGSLYHLDGPQAIRHLPDILAYKKLSAINWVPGAGAPGPTHWIDLMRRIQAGGKGVHMMNVQPQEAIELCRHLEPGKLFLVMNARSIEDADDIVRRVREACDDRRARSVSKA